MGKGYKLKDYERMSDEEFNRLNDELNRKKRSGKGIRNCMIFFAVIVVALIVFGGNDDTDTSANTTTASTSTTTATTTKPSNSTTTTNKTTTNTTTPKTETKKEPETIVYDAELTDGNYTVGIDLPAGRYTITAVAGNGNVSSSNMWDGGLSEMMGVDGDSDLYIPEFKNARLDDGVVLEISNGVTVKIHSDKADATPLKKRVQPNTETVRLTNGYYYAGEDFPAGVYDVVAVEGTGNVSSDNMWDGGINAMMGISDGSWADLYSKEYKNIDLPEGTELEVSNGVTVDLVPSK